MSATMGVIAKAARTVLIFTLIAGMISPIAVSFGAFSYSDVVGMNETEQVDQSLRDVKGDVSGWWENATKPPDESRVARLTHQKVNERRAEHGRGNLSWEPELKPMATQHSRHMARDDFFDHTSPGGETMTDRYERHNIGCARKGENLFSMTYSGKSYTANELADQAVSGWMISPGHRENLLRAGFTREAIGVDIREADGETTVHVTQNFCG